MKIAVTFIPLILLVCPLWGQSLEKRVLLLQRENDSLRLELEKCKTDPFQRLTQYRENDRFAETPNYSRTELRAKLLPQIKSKSAEKYATAQNVITRTDSFITYCDGLLTTLISRTGGLDSVQKRPVGMRDKQIGTQFFITEKHGSELKSKIITLRNYYIKMVNGNQDFERRISLDLGILPQKPDTSWEEFKFKAMPLAALLPILGKYRADAITSETAVLQYLNE